MSFNLVQLTELTGPAWSDIVYIVDDPSGTPLSRKCTVSNLNNGPRVRALTNNVATKLFDIALADGGHTGGSCTYTIKVTGSAGIQTHSGIIYWSANRTGSTYTTDIRETSVSGEAIALSAGTLADTWSMTSGSGIVTVLLNANSNLADITLETCTYCLHRHCENAITFY
jgi:hypothetical protein